MGRWAAGDRAVCALPFILKLGRRVRRTEEGDGSRQRWQKSWRGAADTHRAPASSASRGGVRAARPSPSPLPISLPPQHGVNATKEAGGKPLLSLTAASGPQPPRRASLRAGVGSGSAGSACPCPAASGTAPVPQPLRPADGAPRPHGAGAGGVLWLCRPTPRSLPRRTSTPLGLIPRGHKSPGPCSNKPTRRADLKTIFNRRDPQNML